MPLAYGAATRTGRGWGTGRPASLTRTFLPAGAANCSAKGRNFRCLPCSCSTASPRSRRPAANMARAWCEPCSISSPTSGSSPATSRATRSCRACLRLDALWQLLGFFLGWVGSPGKGRALGTRRGEIFRPGAAECQTGDLRHRYQAGHALEARARRCLKHKRSLIFFFVNFCNYSVF